MINMRLRDDYIKDAAGGVKRWNALIAKTGVQFEMTIPHQAFHRQIGEFASVRTTPAGDIISQEEYDARRDEWLPSSDDAAYIQSLMKPCLEAGKYAGWIAPPRIGIDNKPGDFEYVQLHDS
jgi:benzoyl-CoA 2,3-dioxygenase component B